MISQSDQQSSQLSITSLIEAIRLPLKRKQKKSLKYTIL